MQKNWWLIPAAIVGYILYKKYVLSQTFSVFFKSLDFTSLTLLNPTLNLVVQVNNPTNVTADIQNIKGNLFLNGDPFITAPTPAPPRCQPPSAQTLPAMP